MSTKTIEIHFLPDHFQPQHLQGKLAMPIDVLRANTTITTALAHGAEAVHPMGSVEETVARSQQLSDSVETVICGGERKGRKIDGFELGNSPLEYSRERVANSHVVFTTTNGTRAIEACKQAQQLVIPALVNLSAAVQFARTHDRIALVCAGTDGDMTSEDILVAGAIAEQLCGDPSFGIANEPSKLALNIARKFWQTTQRQMRKGVKLAEILKLTQGGHNLVQLGFDKDIAFAAQIDFFDCLPILEGDALVSHSK